MWAGIYARISQDIDGTELGVSRQIEDCREEAERRGWDVADTFTDNDVSATRSKVRPQYQRMIAAVEAGQLGAIIVWDVDRLTRTPRELEDIIDLADKHGLQLANVGGDIDLSTPQGRMTARIKGTVARHDTDQQSRRLRRKFEEKAQKGEPHGYCPYGYTRVVENDERGHRIGARDVINPDQAAVIREAAERALAGESLRSIVAGLNERGIHGPKSPQWNSTILRQLLLRPSNAGLRQHRGVVVGPSQNEPIFSPETHDRLKAFFADPDRKSNHSGPGFKFLLSGLALCGLCGGTMRRQMGKTVVSKQTGATKRQPPSYACSACFKVRRQQGLVDDLVEAVIVARLARPDALAAFTTGDPQLVEDAREKVSTLEARMALAADQFADGGITGEQLKRISVKLRAGISEAKATIAQSTPNTAYAELAGPDVAQRWRALPLDIKRQVVDALLTVTINPVGPGRPFDPDSVVVDWRAA
jgi:site-specific DNA recombinase